MSPPPAPCFCTACCCWPCGKPPPAASRQHQPCRRLPRSNCCSWIRRRHPQRLCRLRHLPHHKNRLPAAHRQRLPHPVRKTVHAAMRHQTPQLHRYRPKAVAPTHPRRPPLPHLLHRQRRAASVALLTAAHVKHHLLLLPIIWPTRHRPTRRCHRNWAKAARSACGWPWMPAVPPARSKLPNPAASPGWTAPPCRPSSAGVLFRPAGAAKPSPAASSSPFTSISRHWKGKFSWMSVWLCNRAMRS